jgi:hypothetical protein
MFRTLYGLARFGFLMRAIVMFAEGKPFALLSRIGMSGLRKAARAEEKRDRVRGYVPQPPRHRKAPIRTVRIVPYSKSGRTQRP